MKRLFLSERHLLAVDRGDIRCLIGVLAFSVAVFILGVIFPGCAPVPAETPSRPAPSSTCETACNALLRLGCAEGADNCPWIMQRMNDWAATRDKLDGRVLTCASVTHWTTLDDLTRHSNWTCTQMRGRGSWMTAPMPETPANVPGVTVP